MLFISSLKSKKLIVIIKNWDESDIIVFTKWERQAFAVWFGKKNPEEIVQTLPFAAV